MPKFKLCFSDHRPGEPGGGGYDSTLPASAFPMDEKFIGSYEEAKEEVMRINCQDYFGDFAKWVEREKLKVVLLSGPSCVGKGPLQAALKEFYSEIDYATVPTIKSYECRAGKPRPDEVDIWDDPNYFRSAEEIRSLEKWPAKRDFIVGDCYGYPQAIDLKAIANAESDLVLLESYHTLGKQLTSSTEHFYGVDWKSVFISPFTEYDMKNFDEAEYNVELLMTCMMHDKLVARGKFQGEDTGKKDYQTRAADTYNVMKSARNYSHLLVNQDSEGHPNWNRLPNGEFTAVPEGDALETLESLVNIIKGNGDQYRTKESLVLN